MRALDRSFFRKSIPLSAARVRDRTQISKCRTELGHDVLKLDRVQAVRSVRGDGEGQEGKAVLLRPEVDREGTPHGVVVSWCRRRTGVGGRGELRCRARCVYVESEAGRVGRDGPREPLAV